MHNTLYSETKESNNIQKKTKEIEKEISQYLNRREIRKIILNGLKEYKYIEYNIDDKKIKLNPNFVEVYLTKSHYKYNFTIEQNDKTLSYLVITPEFFNTHLNVKLNPYTKEYINLINPDLILHYLKIIIGVE